MNKKSREHHKGSEKEKNRKDNGDSEIQNKTPHMLYTCYPVIKPISELHNTSAPLRKVTH